MPPGECCRRELRWDVSLLEILAPASAGLIPAKLFGDLYIMANHKHILEVKEEKRWLLSPA